MVLATDNHLAAILQTAVAVEVAVAVALIMHYKWYADMVLRYVHMAWTGHGQIGGY
jgi:hypothetical protein